MASDGGGVLLPLFLVEAGSFCFGLFCSLWREVEGSVLLAAVFSGNRRRSLCEALPGGFEVRRGGFHNFTGFASTDVGGS